jgi:hypothetical protein
LLLGGLPPGKEEYAGLAVTALKNLIGETAHA